MSIELHTVTGGNVRAINDARLYEALTSGKSGLVEGGVVTASGGLVAHISSGWGVILGRVFSIETDDISVTPSTSGTMLGRLYLRIDLTDTENPITIESEASTTLRNLTTEDINNNGTVYEYELAHYNVTEVAISNLVSNTQIELTPEMTDYIRKDAFSYDSATQTLTITLE